MEKKLVSFVLVIFLVATIPLIQAEDVQQVIAGEAPFSLGSWLIHNLGLNLFMEYSIVGDARSCSDTYDERISLQSGQEFTVWLHNYCSPDAGLVDTYVNGWNPYKEFKNDISFTCTPSRAPCNIEVYCCPHPECSSDSNCRSWYGSNSECITSHEMDRNIELDFNTWYYCETPDYIDCWYLELGDNACSRRRYNGQTECPSTYMGHRLYEDEDECNDESARCGDGDCNDEFGETQSNCCRDCGCQSGYTCQNNQCTQNQCTPNCVGKSCGADDGCGHACQTGSCPSGKTCQAGVCVNSCTPNCVGKNCGTSDGCGGTCKTGNCPSGQTCQNGVCISSCTPQCSGKQCGPDGCGGICGTCQSGYTCNNGQCIQNQVPQAQFQITSGPTFSKTTGHPGDSIPVTLTIKNIGTVSGTYYVESGIAKKGLGGYAIGGSLFDLYSVVNFKCCQANEFYDGKKVTLGAGQSETVTLNPKVPNENSRDPPECNNQGSVWAGYGSNYWIGFNACNNCYGETNHTCIERFSDNWETFTVEEEVQLYCGDGICNNGETKNDCCIDCGCPTGKQCDEIEYKCITPPPVEECGDGEVTGEEQCDGTNLNGETCTRLGYDSGSLSCSNYCLYNTENCVDDTPENPPEPPAKELCITFANDIVNPITKNDNCTTNTIIFFVGIFVIFVIFMSVIKR